MEFPSADIIIVALIAGFILLRLRSILGQDRGFDSRNDPKKNIKDIDFTEIDEQKTKDASVITIPAAMKPAQKLKAELAIPNDQALIDSLGISQKLGIEAIKKTDPSFNLHSFLNGAKGAFEMVLKAFNEADHQVFNMLMTPQLAQVFIRESETRAKNENKHETTLVSIISTEVKSAELDKKIARITLHIVSEQIAVIRDKQGDIIEGDPSYVERVEDEWTFERDTTSKNPNWMIVDT